MEKKKLSHKQITKNAIKAAVDQSRKFGTVATIVDEMKDKEIEFLPILQKLEGLINDTKLLTKKLKQMENSIEELKKEILEV